MTPKTLEEILEAMKAEATVRDLERAHQRADGLLIEALRNLAWGEAECQTVEEIIAAFERLERWYA